MTVADAARELTFASPTGVRLVGDTRGDDDGRPVLLLHGGGQTRHAWGGTADAVAAAGHRAVTLDMRGHGESGWAEDGDYSHDAFITDVDHVTSVLSADAGGRRVVLVGASMGGIVSLLGLGERRLSAAGLILVDIGTRAEETGVAKILTFMRSGGNGFASLDEAADAVAAYQPHRPRPKDTSGLRKNLRLRDDGRWYWHWDPAFLDGTGKVPRRSRDPERLEAAARALTLPVLLVRGARSDVISPEGVAAFREQVPHAEFVDVAGAGHMVAGDRNDAFTDAVVGFLGELPEG